MPIQHSPSRAARAALLLVALAGAACTDDAPAPTPGPGTPPSGNPNPGTPTPGTPSPGTPTPGTPNPGMNPGPAASRRFFLPTGEPDNTSAPTVELDAQGGIHTIYPAFAGGDAYYGYCGKDCAGSDAVKVVPFKTEGTVHNAMIALTATGQPRVLLATGQKLYWASCDAGCTQPTGWRTTMILDHQGDREVTGEALALDPQGRPRFMMHTYRALFGIGQKPKQTLYLRCDVQGDGACHDPAAWQSHVIQNETWEGTHLRFDATGRAHVATVAEVKDASGNSKKMGAYLTCAADSPCQTETDWNGIGLYQAYESLTEAITMAPAVSLALTRAGGPRVLVLGKNPESGAKQIVYFECDGDCAKDNWRASGISDHSQIGPGLDLALDRNDRPRFVYTLAYNIGLAWCDDATCAGGMPAWDLTKVELGSELPPDQIILWPNCTVAAWFLHGPSLALTADGAPRVGYQARDISGGFSTPDPTRPSCVAGTDMTWSRLAVLPSYK